MIAIAVVAVALGAALQSAVGFGMALIVVPALVWSGQPLSVSVAVLMGAGLFQTAHGTWTARAHVQWRFAWGLASIQWLCLPIGLLGMQALDAHGPARVRQAVGIVVLVLISARAIVRPTPRARLGLPWAIAAAGSSAVLAGMVGMGGPPMVLFAMAHDWGKQRFRAFLWSQFLLVLPVAIAMLAWRFGPELLEHVALGLATAPAVWVGSHVGLAVSARWEARELQRAATLLLYAVGLFSVIAPFAAS